MEAIDILLSAGVGAGIMKIADTIINHWLKKNDKEDAKIAALIEAQKLIMQGKVDYLGSKFIAEGKISLRNKEMLRDMHKAYKNLGGNGHLDTIMREVDKLPIGE